MSKQANQKIVSPNISAESIDQPLDFGMCKIKGVTSLTLMGDPTVRSFGSRQPDFFYGLVHQIANASSKGESPDELGIKFMLAFVKSLTPRDEIDAMLATQMAATHVAAMKYANRLAEAETLQEQDSAERAYNKLIRTFATLVEMYERRRASSEKVAVQNVSVSSGGQAIIGNVTQPPLQPVLKLPDFRQAPMESIGESQRVPVRRRAKR